MMECFQVLARYEERWRLTNLVIPIIGVVFFLVGLTIHAWPFIVFGVLGVLLYILEVTVYRIGVLRGQCRKSS